MTKYTNYLLYFFSFIFIGHSVDHGGYVIVEEQRYIDILPPCGYHLGNSISVLCFMTASILTTLNYTEGLVISETTEVFVADYNGIILTYWSLICQIFISCCDTILCCCCILKIFSYTHNFCIAILLLIGLFSNIPNLLGITGCIVDTQFSYPIVFVYLVGVIISLSMLGFLLCWRQHKLNT